MGTIFVCEQKSARYFRLQSSIIVFKKIFRSSLSYLATYDQFWLAAPSMFVAEFISFPRQTRDLWLANSAALLRISTEISSKLCLKAFKNAWIATNIAYSYLLPTIWRKQLIEFCWFDLNGRIRLSYPLCIVYGRV